MTSGPQFREGERRLAAVAFTDIVGYSGVVHRDERLGQKMVDRQNTVVQAVLPRFGGRIVKGTGDGFLLVFGSALSAVKAIALIQSELASGDQPVNLRASVHLGDVDYVRGDLYGDGVNTAARLMPLSPDGGIAISAMVRMQVRQQLDLEFRSIGTPPLKNIEAPLEVFVADPPALHALGRTVLEQAPEVAEAEAASPPPARRSWIKPVAALAGAVIVGAAVLLAGRFTGQPRGADEVTNKSIAVLPFANLSSDKEQEYFSDGIAEDLLNLLAKTENLQVAARTSSFSFKGQNLEIPEIARRLHVAHVLEGSVRKAGNQVRVTARLVRAADGFEMWSQTWDRSLDDIFKVQDEIASAVVSGLKVKLLGAEPTARPIDAEVYPLILQAEALLNTLSAPARAQAIEILQRTSTMDPAEPRIWTDLARAYLYRAVFDGANPAESARLAKQAANQALELDPDSALALGWLGRVTADFDLDLQAAADYYQRALEKEPSNLSVLNHAGALLTYIGRVEEGIRVFRYRVAHDPANPSARGNLATALSIAGHFDASIEEFRAALALNPEFAGARCSIALGLLHGKHDAAAALKECEAETDELARMGGLPVFLHALGRTKDAEAALQALIAKYGQDSPESIASTASALGQVDAAFEWLDKSVAIRDPGNATALTDRWFKPLHDDPRWNAYLRKIGYAPEQLAAIELDVKLPQAQAGR